MKISANWKPSQRCATSYRFPDCMVERDTHAAIIENKKSDITRISAGVVRRKRV